MTSPSFAVRAGRLSFQPLLALFLLAIAPAPGAAQATHAGAGHQAVRAAVLDYVEALYQIDPSRIERSVHPDLAKTGYCCTADAPEYRTMKMSFEELRALAGRWNRNGQADPKTAVKDIVVYDVLDQTATAKLTAQWGVDYLHLAKHDGRWMIVNVLWQSPPR